MTISRGQMPRQLYGLGSLVKSVAKTAKKIVKSPIGKAAALYFAPMAFGQGAGRPGAPVPDLPHPEPRRLDQQGAGPRTR